MISYRNTLLIVALLPISQPMSPTILRPGAAIRSLNPFTEDPFRVHPPLTPVRQFAQRGYMHGDTTLGNSNLKSVARDIRRENKDKRGIRVNHNNRKQADTIDSIESLSPSKQPKTLP